MLCPVTFTIGHGQAISHHTLSMSYVYEAISEQPYTYLECGLLPFTCYKFCRISDMNVQIINLNETLFTFTELLTHSKSQTWLWLEKYKKTKQNKQTRKPLVASKMRRNEDFWRRSQLLFSKQPCL